jgi:hypothetical protein
MDGLVDLVEVGTLLAVHLHVDEVAIHQCCDLGILEAFARHHMAPVARRIADREQDRLVLGARPIERFRSPGIPVDRVPRVLLQVGRCLARQPVRHVTYYAADDT